MGSLLHPLRQRSLRFGVPQAALLLVLAAGTRSGTSTVPGACLSRTRLPPHARALSQLRLRGGDESGESEESEDEKGGYESEDDAAGEGGGDWGTER